MHDTSSDGMASLRTPEAIDEAIRAATILSRTEPTQALEKLQGCIDAADEAGLVDLSRISRVALMAVSTFLAIHPEEKSRMLRWIIERDPDRPYFLLFLGDAELRLGNNAHALDAYQRALALAGDDTNLRALAEEGARKAGGT